MHLCTIHNSNMFLTMCTFHLYKTFPYKNTCITAHSVCVEGYCLLPQAFNIVSPMVKYRAEQACRMLPQIPFVSIRIGDPSSGKSFSVLLEKIHGADFTKIVLFINS